MPDSCGHSITSAFIVVVTVKMQLQYISRDADGRKNLVYSISLG